MMPAAPTKNGIGRRMIAVASRCHMPVVSAAARRSSTRLGMNR